MRSLTVDEKHGDTRVDSFLKTAFPRLPFGALQKAFRKRDVKVNGSRVGQDHILKAGDILEVYIVDSILEGEGRSTDSDIDKSFSIIYEDDNIMIVNKKQGVPVHPDREQASGTLIDLVRAYAAQSGNSRGSGIGAFPPSLCHRLDRNTGGLLIIAKNKESLDIIIDKMDSGEIKKFYMCLVKGRMEKQYASLKAYLKKDEHKSRVFVSDSKSPGALDITTRYRMLEYRPDIDASLLEVELLTGRTHQIRAHLAHIGHPVLGDGKYGTNAVNRPLGLKRQVLWAYKLMFDIKDAGRLSYLKGREFKVAPEFPLL